MTLTKRIRMYLALIILGVSTVVIVGLSSFVSAKDTTSSEIDRIDTRNLLTQSMVLNNEIVEETERIREERRQYLLALENERLAQLTSLKEFLKHATEKQLNSFDLRTPSNLTPEQADYLLEGTALSGLGEAYVKAEELHGVNALAMIGISMLESARGTSKLARERNNLFGFRAYDYDINQAMYFKTKEDSILHVAKHLSEKYLDPNGAYFNGYSLDGVNVRYASDKKWSVKIASTLGSMVDKLETVVEEVK